MARQIIASKKFQKNLSKLPTKIITRAEIVVALLRVNPHSDELDIKSVKGLSQRAWRIRIGDYRLIYTYDRNNLYLLNIADRKDVYK